MIKNAIIIILLFVMLFFYSGCGEKSKEETINVSDKINIVTTTGMISDAARNVGGDLVEVTALMGAGVDPHLYKASAGDVERMSNADLILYNGLHLEGAMSEVFEKMQTRVTTFAVAANIEEDKLMLPEESSGMHDPHIWFDVSLWQNAVEAIRDKLIEIDSDRSEIYNSNASEYLKTLQELDQYVKEQAMRVPESKRVLITAHDAFNYFGKAYGFEVRGLQGISTASEAGTADVQNLSTFIAERQIPAVFIESSVPKRAIEAVQAAVKARGFEVSIGGELFSDAMGSTGTPEGVYTGMVKHNIDTIVSALLGE